MYTQQFDQGLLYQGDILKDIPFIVLPDSNIQLPNIENTQVSDDSSRPFFGQDNDVCVAIRYKAMGMIISQNCDIDNKNYILVTPIFPIELRYTNSRNHLISLRKQKVKYEIHLPPINSLMIESFVDLQVINTVKKEFVKIQNRVAVLSDYGRSVLTEHLRDYFGRVEIKPYVEPSPESSG